MPSRSSVGKTHYRVDCVSCRQIELSLGYRKFAAAGGDLGTWVTRALAIERSQNVPGIHLTDCDYPSAELLRGADTTEEERGFAGRVQAWMLTEGAYAFLQSTKPQTLPFGLIDSPVGLAAWIVEKLRSWSDRGGDIEKRFTKDEHLTNVMIYRVSGTIASSVGMYRENAKVLSSGGARFFERSAVPAGVASFPAGIAPLPAGGQSEWRI